MARLIANAQIHGDSLNMVSLSGYFFILSCCFFFHFHLFAQKQTTQRVLTLYESANRTLPFNPEQALSQFYEITRIDSNFAAPYMRIGQILEKHLSKSKEAFPYYEKAVRLDSSEIAFKPIYEILGKYYLSKGHYQTAEKYFRGYLKFPNPYFPIKKSIERYLSQCSFGQKMVAKTPNLPISALLQPPLNSFLAQSYPVLTADLNTLVFTGFNGDEDLLVSYRTSTGWSSPKSLSDSINTNLNEGTCSISADGQTLVFTGCNRKDGYGKCDLYITKKIDKNWQKPKNMGAVVNSAGWESQPSLSADGHTLYFSSDRQIGVGGKDIWVTKIDTAGDWTPPRNLGETINTTFDEIAPFIHSNGETIFFSSDGRAGMGGFDLYISRLSDEWSVPTNLGYPINTFADQTGLFIAPDCQQAFYSQQMSMVEKTEIEQSKIVLCELQLPDTLIELCPKAYVFKGRVMDSETHQTLVAALTIQSLEIDEPHTSEYSTNHLGEFLSVLPKKSKWTVFIESNGYYSKSLVIDLAESIQETDIYLRPWKTRESEVLNNVFFRIGSAELEPISEIELNRLSNFLQKNSTIRLVIEGHTDDLGNNEKNLILSQKRAEEVVKYLIKMGTSPHRLEAKGQGATKPLLQNSSEEARQKNRRVTWRVIE